MTLVIRTATKLFDLYVQLIYVYNHIIVGSKKCLLPFLPLNFSNQPYLR